MEHVTLDMIFPSAMKSHGFWNASKWIQGTVENLSLRVIELTPGSYPRLPSRIGLYGIRFSASTSYPVANRCKFAPGFYQIQIPK